MLTGHRAFLCDQFHSMVLQATVQRAAIYELGASETVREEFRRGLRQRLDAAATAYATPIAEQEHIGRIAALARSLSKDHAGALRGGAFRIGPAQKALNLFLKYQWCSGWIPMPPHCPFDALIIAQLPRHAGVAWTRLDSVEAYESLVAAARSRAGSVPLAEWELDIYARVSGAAQRATQR